MRGIESLTSRKRLLVRLDINSPVENGTVQDNRRFRRHAATVQQLVDSGHAVVCLAHQGRPENDSFVRLEQHATLLQDHLDSVPVEYIQSVADDTALRAARSAAGGDVVLLENVRMHPDELAERSPKEHADSDLVRSLASCVDAYVNDGFSVSHRPHASIVGFPYRLPSAAGPVMQAEYEAAASLRQRSFDGPVVLACGGVKADDVLYVMRNVDDVVDTFLVSGVLGELFLRAEGYPVGISANGDAPYDELWEEHEQAVRTFLAQRRDDIVLPLDLARERDGQRVEDDVGDINTKTTPYYDIGEDTVAAFASEIEGAAAVFMKGAAGVFERELFSAGTTGVLDALAVSDAYTVVGGGDTAHALSLYGYDESAFSHVSVAGGAYIRALTGDDLAGITALEQSL